MTSIATSSGNRWSVCIDWDDQCSDYGKNERVYGSIAAVFPLFVLRELGDAHTKTDKIGVFSTQLGRAHVKLNSCQTDVMSECVIHSNNLYLCVCIYIYIDSVTVNRKNLAGVLFFGGIQFPTDETKFCMDTGV